jgi:hypothetical protein
MDKVSLSLICDRMYQGGQAPQTADGLVRRPMRIAPARGHDVETVLSLIEEALAWLPTKDTDQWAVPGPDKQARRNRILRGLYGAKTWIVWDGDFRSATVTIAPQANRSVWSNRATGCDLSESAVYVHRLITSRAYAGMGINAELIDWADLGGRREYGAKWVRIDVWTTNRALRDYYGKAGFEPCGTCADSLYPAGALFQKPVSEIQEASSPLFYEQVPKPLIQRSTIPARAVGC